MLPGQCDTEVATAAQAAGVLVTPGSYAFLAEAPGGFLRLGYAMVEASWVDAAARIVAEVIVGRNIL